MRSSPAATSSGRKPAAKRNGLSSAVWARLPTDVLFYCVVPLCDPACYPALCLTCRRGRETVARLGDHAAWLRLHLRRFAAAERAARLAGYDPDRVYGVACHEPPPPRMAYHYAGAHASAVLARWLSEGRQLRWPTLSLARLDGTARFVHATVPRYWLWLEQRTDGERLFLLQRLLWLFGGRAVLLRALATRRGGWHVHALPSMLRGGTPEMLETVGCARRVADPSLPGSGLRWEVCLPRGGALVPLSEDWCTPLTADERAELPELPSLRV